uniref:Macaca fascicularis brain cDNA clone: QmoA-10989, similar to human CREBBP/EP300 inhibitory protein 1 (CRI1), mRNA, RefSeq: NM_014335.2 n=1 Tax=Macaca fascicularis TaxID=9541 RepID=I7G870_MACFA|nr:unnamed protein product [Macaca fascicularis]
MSEMAELSELYEESSDLQMDVMPGEGDLPQMEVGSGSRELSLRPSRNGAPPQLEEEGPMEEEEAQPMAGARGETGALLTGPTLGSSQARWRAQTSRARTRARNLMTGRTTTTIPKRSSLVVPATEYQLLLKKPTRCF